MQEIESLVRCRLFTALVSLGLAIALVCPAASFSSKRLGVSFREPQGWKQVGVSGNVVARYLAPARPGLRPQIAVSVCRVEGATELTPEHVAHSLVGLDQASASVTILGDKPVSIDGQSGHRVRLRETVNKKRVDACIVYFLREESLYVFTLTAGTDNYAGAQAQFSTMLRSIHFQ